MAETPYPTMPIAELLQQFAPYNPRRLSEQQFEALQRSIDEFGFVEPVVVNTQTKKIVGGHQRVRAAKAVGLTEVPVYMVSLSEPQEKALNVALNRISGDWDSQLLVELLEGLDEGMRDLTGFDDDELNRLLGDPFTADVDEPGPKVSEPRYTIGQLKSLARSIYPTQTDVILDFLDVVEKSADDEPQD